MMGLKYRVQRCIATGLPLGLYVVSSLFLVYQFWVTVYLFIASSHIITVIIIIIITM